MLNGVNHILKRNSISNEISIKIDTSEFQLVTEEEVRRLLPIQAYSQKQLSSVGVTGEELKRFIQSPILNEIGFLNFQLEDNINKTRSIYLNLLRKREIEKENVQFSLEVTSLTNQVQHLRQSLTGISPTDQATIARKPILEIESNYVTSVQRELNTISNKINDLDLAFQNMPEQMLEGPFENTSLIDNINIARVSKVNEIKNLVTQIKDALKPENSVEVRNLITQWRTLKTNYDALYELAKSMTSSNQTQLTEISRIEEKLNQIRNNINERQDMLRQLGDPFVEFSQLRSIYWALHLQKSEILNEEAVKFEELSKGQIKVEVLKNLDLDLIKDQLTKALQGARIQADKIQTICDKISSSENPISQWNLILGELKVLAEFTTQGELSQNIPESEILSQLGFNPNNIKRITEHLTTDSWTTFSIDDT